MSFFSQARYNAVCLEREEVREQNSQVQTEMCALKETVDRCVASNKIEVSFSKLWHNLIQEQVFGVKMFKVQRHICCFPLRWKCYRRR